MKPTKSLPLSLTIARRELRHGYRHFAVFVLCIMLGVGVMATVSSLAGVVERSLANEAQSLLGGDAEVEIRGVAANAQEKAHLATLGAMSHISTVRAMVQHNGQPTLVEVKAVDRAYPLMGRVELHEAMPLEAALAGDGVVVDQTLLVQLGIAVGEQVQIGKGHYTIRATLKREPDRAVHIFNFGPRVMMSHEALAKAGIAGTFSLVTHSYRLRIANPPQAELLETQLRDSLSTKFPATSWRVKTGTDGNRSIQRFLDQLLAFLTLSGLATFLIGGIGIGSSVRAYLEKKSGTIGVLKIMGALRVQVLQSYLLVLTFLALLGGVIGIVISAIATHILMQFVGEWLPVTDGQSGIVDIKASLLALWYGLIITYLFSMPALLGALNVRPAALFRTHAGRLPVHVDRTLVQVMTGLGLLLVGTLLATASDMVFIAGAIGVLLLAFALFALCARMVRWGARRVHSKHFWLRMALGNLHRPGSTTGTVIFAIGISMTVLVALTLTEANFQARIASVVEEKAPSLFMIDIQPQQKDELETLLKSQAGENAQVMLYPMIRGRITALNGNPVKPEDVDDDVRWAVRGDRGLSYGATLPPNAVLSEGEWWPQDYCGEPLVSVDKRFLAGMKLKLGDTMTVNVLGEDIVTTIANARDIDYTTLQINFAMMLSPGVINDFPHTYLSTVHMEPNPEAESALVQEMVSRFPGMTIIRTAEVVELVREVMGHIATALKLAVAISLFAGLLVLTSALSATIDQRLYDAAILKVLGARQSDILKACTAEWMLLALMTSVIAAVIGSFAAWLTLERLRSTGFSPMPEVILGTILGCMAVIWLTGYFGNRRIFRLRAASWLRNE